MSAFAATFCCRAHGLFEVEPVTIGTPTEVLGGLASLAGAGYEAPCPQCKDGGTQADIECVSAPDVYALTVSNRLDD